MADVWGVPVRRRSILEEANSLGAAVTAEFTTDDSRHRDYVARHATFIDGYASLAPWFSKRTGN